MVSRKIMPAALAAAVAAVALPASADAQVIRIKRNPSAIILDAARVNAGADMVFVSGQLASPVDPTKPMSEVKSVEDLGDTKTQTVSVLGKVKDILATQGFKMSDVIKLTLFVAAVVLIVDMITLVNNVLGGELTLRFLLKVLVAALIAGSIFGYYLWDLRKEEQEA